MVDIICDKHEIVVGPLGEYICRKCRGFFSLSAMKQSLRRWFGEEWVIEYERLKGQRRKVLSKMRL